MRFRRLLQPDVLIPTLALAARLIPGPRTVDDAYITFRYAQNLISGHGLVYNPGEAVLGTTTPLYALLMAALALPFGGAHAPYPTLAWLANAAADAVTCWLLMRLAEALGHRGAGIAAALVWAVAPYSVTFAIGGLETSVFVALASATLYCHWTDRPIGAAACGGLALLARPDALILLAPIALERLRRSLPRGKLNPTPLPVRGREALAFVVPVLAWSLAAVLAYGSPLPQSISAKAFAYRLPPLAGLVRLLQHYATPFMDQETFSPTWVAAGAVVYPLLFVLGAVTILRGRPSAWPILTYPWFYFLAFAVANPLIFRWYLTPPLPIYFLGIFTGVARLGRDLKAPYLAAAVGAAAVALSLHAWTLKPDHGPERPAPKMAYIQLELLYQRVSYELEGEIRPGQVLAAGDVGVLGYLTGARILDTIGLVSPQAARYYPLPASLYTINYAIPPALIDDQRPDFVVILEVYGRNGLLLDPIFRSAYDLEQALPTDIYGSRGMLVFRRRAGPG